MLQIKLEQAGIATSLGRSSSSSANGGSGGVGGGSGGAGANALGGLSSTVDPKGYLTGLDSQMLKTSSEIGYVVFPSPSCGYDLTLPSSIFRQRYQTSSSVTSIVDQDESETCTWLGSRSLVRKRRWKTSSK